MARTSEAGVESAGDGCVDVQTTESAPLAPQFPYHVFPKGFLEAIRAAGADFPPIVDRSPAGDLPGRQE